MADLDLLTLGLPEPEVFLDADPNVDLQNAFADLRPHLQEWAAFYGVAAAFGDVVFPEDLTYADFLGRLSAETFGARPMGHVVAARAPVAAQSAPDVIALESRAFPNIDISIFYKLAGEDTNSTLHRTGMATATDNGFLYLADRVQRALPDVLGLDVMVVGGQPVVQLLLPNFSKKNPKDADLVLQDLRAHLYERLGATAPLVFQSEVEEIVRAACEQMQIAYREPDPLAYTFWVSFEDLKNQSSFLAREAATGQTYSVTVRNAAVLEDLRLQAQSWPAGERVPLIVDRQAFGHNQREAGVYESRRLPDGTEFFPEPVFQQTSLDGTITVVPVGTEDQIADAYRNTVQDMGIAAAVTAVSVIPGKSAPAFQNQQSAPRTEATGVPIRPIRVPSLAGADVTGLPATNSVYSAAYGRGVLNVEGTPNHSATPGRSVSESPSVLVLQSGGASSTASGLQTASSAQTQVGRAPQTAASARPQNQGGYTPNLPQMLANQNQTGRAQKGPMIAPAASSPGPQSAPGIPALPFVGDGPQRTDPLYAPSADKDLSPIGDRPEDHLPLTVAGRVSADPEHDFLGLPFEEAFGFEPKPRETYSSSYAITGESRTLGDRISQDFERWDSLDFDAQQRLLQDLNTAFVAGLKDYAQSDGRVLGTQFVYANAVERLQLLLQLRSGEVVFADLLALIENNSDAYHIRLAQAIRDAQTDYKARYYGLPNQQQPAQTPVSVRVPNWKNYNLARVYEYASNISKLHKDCQNWRRQSPEEFEQTFDQRIANDPQNYNAFLAMLLQTAGNAKLPGDTRARAQAYLDKFYPQHRAYQEWKKSNSK